MSIRNTVLAAAAAVATFAFVPAQVEAQTYYYYGVHSTSQTLGYAGTFTDDSQLQQGWTAAYTLSDPQGATLASPGYATLYADVGAGSEARQAELRAWASGQAQVVSGTNVNGSTAAPYGSSYAHFNDRLAVVSNVLPKGTPVTIVFGNDVEIHRWERVGAYSGSIDMTLQIAAGSARSRWSAHYLYGDTTAVAPQIVIQTTVGSVLSVDARLRVMAKAFYKLGTPGDIHADATARVVVREITEGVTLQSASGTLYPIVPAN